MLKSLLRASIVVGALAACEEQSAAPTATHSARVQAPDLFYQCGAISVRFNPDSKILKAGGKTFALRDAISASGARYEDGAGTSFWSKGERGLLVLKGAEHPECVERGVGGEASGGEILRARGNEPGWLLELGSATFKLQADYGETVIAARTPAADDLTDGVLYNVPEYNLSIRVTDRLCNDDSTGAPFPKAVTVNLGGKRYKGCGGDAAGLLTGEWMVAEIAGAAALPETEVTLHFDGKGRVSGAAGCNRYSADYALTGEGLKIEKAVMTEMACIDPAVMEQEQRFAGRLGSIDRFDIRDDGALVLYVRDAAAIVAKR